VFVNGATRAGRFNPKVVRLGEGLARAGYLVATPDLPGLRLGQVTPRTTDALIRVVRAVAQRRDVADGQVSLYGVSVGATLALLAAESPVLARRVRAVGGEAPWTSLEKMIRLATTGLYGDRPYRTDPYLRLAIARSLAASLPSRRDRTLLVTRLDAVPDHDASPLATLRRAMGLGAGGRSLVALLLNRRPGRFARLYARLPARVRAGVALLSPLSGARRVEVPVELASAPHDKYFPPAESRALERRSRHVRLTITSTLVHAVPHLSFRDLGDLLHFDEFLVRFLSDTARR
jgi:dienelactone hydrolase